MDPTSRRYGPCGNKLLHSIGRSCNDTPSEICNQAQNHPLRPLQYNTHRGVTPVDPSRYEFCDDNIPCNKGGFHNKKKRRSVKAS